MNDQKIVISAALLGSTISKRECAAIPLTPEEIIEDAYKCYLAGASMVHIHVRDKNNKPTLDFEVYKDVISGIRSACEVLICVSTSNYLVNISDKKRLKLFELDADLASLMPGGMIRNGEVYENSDTFIIESLNIMKQKNIKPELEIFSKEMLVKCVKLHEAGLLCDKPYVQFVLGSPGATDNSYLSVQWMLDSIREEWVWSAAGIGKLQLPLNIIGMLNGANVIRTGIEDNIYYLKHRPVADNASFVKRLKKIAPYFGRAAATVSEAAKILKLNGNKR